MVYIDSSSRLSLQTHTGRCRACITTICSSTIGQIDAFINNT